MRVVFPAAAPTIDTHPIGMFDMEHADRFVQHLDHVPSPPGTRPRTLVIHSLSARLNRRGSFDQRGSPG